MKQALVKLGMYREQENNHHEWLDHTTRYGEDTKEKKTKQKNYVFAALKRSQFRAKDVNSLVAMLCQH